MLFAIMAVKSSVKYRLKAQKDAKGLSRKQSLKPSLSAKILLGGKTPGQQG